MTPIEVAISVVYGLLIMALVLACWKCCMVGLDWLYDRLMDGKLRGDK